MENLDKLCREKIKIALGRCESKHYHHKECFQADKLSAVVSMCYS